MFYTIVIPVFNRPDEVDELLQSLCQQTDTNFEVIIVEDGSNVKCDGIVNKFQDKLQIQYFFKQNSGPGTSRNYGAKLAKGDYIIFFDSDCIIPQNYFKAVNNFLSEKKVDAFGGPDKAHSSFTNIQKAINYAMTSFFTTGGIRGGSEKMDKFYPRSFNMGYSKEVFEVTKGYGTMRFGEDIEMSIRIIENNFSTALIKDAFVYHKRRTDLKKFFKQVFNSGMARINLMKLHKNSLKIVHLLPSVFVLGCISIVLLSVFVNISFLFLLVFYCLIIFIDSLRLNKNFNVAIISIAASFVQLFGYGTGFLTAFWKRVIMGNDDAKAFTKNFYK